MADCRFCLGEGTFGKITCDYCQGSGRQPVDRAARDAHHHSSLPHTAIYDGRCAGCGGPIAVGDQIRPLTGEDGWIGECCA
jgi:DnaJ-class molecular chaperone